ncbi:hypothetical protein Fmac_012002 [Flemingia macrophylla]|uniref:Uncharacterized protein n=1 Tax=Flemingia macrophylla TaxID=520843 RepID=A0ABD1MP26_9FABA
MNMTLLAKELGLAVKPMEVPTKKVVQREEIVYTVMEVIAYDENGKSVFRANLFVLVSYRLVNLFAYHAQDEGCVPS